MKVHLHEEQFDNRLHAACCRAPFDPPAPDPRIVGEDDFEATPKDKRCRYCARIWWPRGGEPR
jgi:hypothetical protein